MAPASRCYNSYGQLGDGTMTQRSAPVQVAALTNVVALASGAYHALALLGDGTTLNRLSAVHVPSP